MATRAAVIRQQRYRLAGQGCELLLLTGDRQFVVDLPAGAVVSQDGDYQGTGAAPAFSWAAEEAEVRELGADPVAAPAPPPAAEEPIHADLAPLGGSWQVAVGSSRTAPTWCAVSRLPKPKPAHQDLLDHYNSERMGGSLLLYWDDALAPQLAAIHALFSEARASSRAVVVAPPRAVADWAALIERTAMTTGSQRGIQVLVLPITSLLQGRLPDTPLSAGAVDLLVVDRPPPDLDAAHLANWEADRTLVLCTPARFPPVHLAEQFSVVNASEVPFLRADLGSADIYLIQDHEPPAQDALGARLDLVWRNALTVDAWPQVVLLPEMPPEVRNRVVRFFADKTVREVVQLDGLDEAEGGSREVERLVRAEVVDGAVSDASLRRICGDLKSRRRDILVCSRHLLTTGSTWIGAACPRLQKVAAVHLPVPGGDLDVEDTLMLAVRGHKVRAEGEPAVIVARYALGERELQEHAAADVARADRLATLNTLLQHSISMAATYAWQPAARARTAKAGPKPVTVRDLQTKLDWPGATWSIFATAWVAQVPPAELPRLAKTKLAKFAKTAATAALTEIHASQYQGTTDIHAVDIGELLPAVQTRAAQILHELAAEDAASRS